MKNLYFFLLFILSSFIAAGQDVRIHGTITDAENKPLEFVTVRIGGTATGTTSGLDGGYSLTTHPADTIEVIFTCIGFKEVKRKLVDAQSDVSLSIKMMPLSVDLKGVEVTDFKKQTTQMQTIDAKAASKMPSVSGNGVENVIQTMAGVSQSDEMSSQYSVRGGTFDENSVYINGIEVFRPQLVSSGQQEGLSIINSDLVGAIGFSTGGFGASYADRMSSVLDITYRDPQAFEGTVGLSLMGVNFAVGQNSKKFSQLHGLRYKRNTSLLSSMETKGEYDPDFFDYQTNLVFKPSNKFRISFLGNIAINNYKFIPASRQTNFGTSTDAKQFKVYFDGQEKDRFETWFGALSLDYRHNRSSKYSLIAGGFLTNELVSYDISGEYWLDQAGTTGGSGENTGPIGGELGVGRYHEHARNRLKMEIMTVGFKGQNGISNHNISYGINLNHETIHDRAREYELRDSAGFTLPVNPDAIKMIYNLDSHQNISTNRLSFFAEDTYKIQSSAGYFNITAGVRMSYWDFNKEFLVSPRVNVAFVPEKNNSWTFRLATGLYYQAPFYKEYRMPVDDGQGNNIIVLNKDIKSQRSLQFIGGADYTFRAFDRPFKLSGELYYKKLDDLIPYELDNLKLVYSGVNSTNGYAMGLDLKLFGQFVPGSDSWVSFSVMKTDELMNGVHVPRPTDRRYSFSLFFTDYFPKFPRLKFSLRGIFNDGLPVTAPRTTRDKGYFRAPAYKRVDVGLSYALIPERKEGESYSGLRKAVKSAWLGVDVFNLLDISNVSGYYWVTDVNNIQYAVPNYLTRRQFNVRLTIDF